MKSKALKITLSIVVGIILGITVVLGLVKIGERILFAPYYFNSTTEFKVPGLADGFVQQGFDFYDAEKDEDDRFFVSGYMKGADEDNRDSSRIYVLDRSGKVLSFTQLREKDTYIEYIGHCGGIAHDGEYLYVSNDDNNDMSLDVFKLDDVLSGKKQTAKLGSIYVYQKPAFCYVADGKLYTGNFHREETRGLAEKGKKEYLSPDEVIALGDDVSNALMTVFEIDHEKYADNFGVASEPMEAYAIPNQVQGMCMTENGNVVFSTSWGVSKSHLYIYDMKGVRDNTKTTTSVFKNETLFGDKALDKDVTLYVMGGEHLYKDVKAPPMAEEMVYLDGKIYVMNESASKKYIFGRFLSGTYVNAYKTEY